LPGGAGQSEGGGAGVVVGGGVGGGVVDEFPGAGRAVVIISVGGSRGFLHWSLSSMQKHRSLKHTWSSHSEQSQSYLQGPLSVLQFPSLKHFIP